MIAGVTHRYLLDLEDPACADPDIAGTKAATLANLARRGFGIPEGMVLTTRAFEDAIGVMEHPTPEAVARGRLPESVESAILKVASRFRGTALAVRSSGKAEDTAGASFAGQYETVLGVRGPEELLDAVRRCWASAFSDQVENYRRTQGYGEAASMAVLIQRLVDAKAAGVAFTADPVTGARDVVIVNAVPGLGVGLVSGEATPEEWCMAAEDIVSTPTGEAVLTTEQALTVAAMARRVETIFGVPQDIEWALEDGQVILLQARPITSLPAVVEPVPVPLEIPDGFWERDASHYPAPHSPLGRSIVYPLMKHTTRFMTEFGMLAEQVVLTDIGGWHYTRIVPIEGKDRKPPPPWLLGILARLHPQMRQRLRTASEAVRTHKGRQVIDRWYEEWQPDLIERVTRLGNTDRANLSDGDLLEHLEAAVYLFDEGILSHIFVHSSLMVETFALAVACRELLGWDDHKMLEMLAGLSERTSEPARELAMLAQMVQDRPEVGRLLDDITEGTSERVAMVDPEFTAAFDAYRWSPLGFRALSRDVADPTLADRPTLLLRLIVNQIETGFAPATVDAANGKRRGELVAEARSALGERQDDLGVFEEALERANRAYPLREDNAFFAVQAPLGVIRYAALEVGHRMAERGQIGELDDIFLLEYPEVISGFRSGDDQHDLVRRRKGELAWVLAHPGPPSYGTPPGPPPSLKYLPAEARYVTEAFQWAMGNTLDKGESQSTASAGIRGVAASPGRYTGPVRVILDESEFGKLKPGDVVVCPVTQPTWSVLFPSIGAVVTDSGGILSHPAIIAREYRIPAVVATGNATELLRDDQLVTVGGSVGTVDVVEQQPS